MKLVIDKNKLKSKYYSTLYFSHTSKVLKKFNNTHQATMQFVSFTEEPYMVCGISEIMEIIKVSLTPSQYRSLTIKARSDGDIILPNEPVLTITGKYSIFAELENIIDSVLARRSSVATNC